MRKFGLIAAIVGFGVLGLDLLLRGLINLSPWAWLPGAVLLSGGSALFLWSRWSLRRTRGPGTQNVEPSPAPIPHGCSTTSSSASPSSRAARRVPPFWAICTPSARSWNSAAAPPRRPPCTGTWRASTIPTAMSPSRLRRLMDAERAKPKAATPAARRGRRHPCAGVRGCALSAASRPSAGARGSGQAGASLAAAAGERR